MGDFLSRRVTLNVGGRRFECAETTLTLGHSCSFFARMLRGDIPQNRDPDGAIFIDRDPDLFHYVLNFLRNMQLVKGLGAATLNALKLEGEFLQLPNLIAASELQLQQLRVEQQTAAAAVAAQAALMHKILDAVQTGNTAAEARKELAELANNAQAQQQTPIRTETDEPTGPLPNNEWALHAFSPSIFSPTRGASF